MMATIPISNHQLLDLTHDKYTDSKSEHSSTSMCLSSAAGVNAKILKRRVDSA